MNIVLYAVERAEDSFTWCGLERYTLMMENQNEFFIIVLIFIDQS